MAVLQYLEAQRNAQPKLAEWYSALSDLYQRKLWHQLTLKLELFFTIPACKAGDTLIQLYHNFISDFETKINLLKLAQLVVKVSRQYVERVDGIEYLEGVIEKLRNTKELHIEEPILFIKLHIGFLTLLMGDNKECNKILDEVKSELDSMTDIDPSVSASYHCISSLQHKSRHEYEEFHKSALLYLAYAAEESISKPAKMGWAFELCISALLGDNIYNFGELLEHPILESLLGTEHEWLYRMIQAFKIGDLIGYQVISCGHSAELSGEPELVENEEKLAEKIYIMRLMDVIFSLSSNDRRIPLSKLGARTSLCIEDVELLLLKSLSVHLMEGIIDQVGGTVYVSWMQPTFLRTSQMKSLCERLDSWKRKICTALENPGCRNRLDP